MIYIQLGKYQDSIPYFQKALQIRPDYKTYADLGTAYLYLKRYPDSVPMFENAVEMSPNDEAFVGNLADSYRWSGQRDKANATYDKAIALAFKQMEMNPRDAETMGGPRSVLREDGQLGAGTGLHPQGAGNQPGRCQPDLYGSHGLCLERSPKRISQVASGSVSKGLFS